MTFTELHEATWEELRVPELEETLNSLQRREKIETAKEAEKILG